MLRIFAQKLFGDYRKKCFIDENKRTFVQSINYSKIRKNRR